MLLACRGEPDRGPFLGRRAQIPGVAREEDRHAVAVLGHARRVARDEALQQMAEEGVVQLFSPEDGSPAIVGVVGALQLDVLRSRIETEYKVAIAFEQAPFETARWALSDDPLELKRFVEAHPFAIAEDRDGVPVFLARNSWDLQRTAEIGRAHV